MSSPYRSSGGRARFVGRDAEIGMVREALAALERGAGGLLQVVGEPGIGKTRLLAVMQELAAERGIRVVSGRAAEFAGGVPFQVFVEALAGDVSELAALVSQDADGDDIGRFRRFQALRQALLATASDPVVMLLDDVHWADQASIEFLEFLSRLPIPAPLLLVIAHRSRQTPPRLGYALARVTDHDASARIELGPLSREEAAELVEVRVGSPRAEELYVASGGNPLYLLASVRCGSAAGGLLESLVLGELAALSPHERTVASTAAVLGETFSAAHLGEASDAEIEAALATLIDRDLVRPVTDSPAFTFRHPLVRRAVYDNAPPAWRILAHRRVLALLTREKAPATELGWHIEQCVDSYAPEHFEVLIQAAEDSTAPLTAAHWFQAALRLLPQTPDFVGIRRLTEYKLARALGLGGRFDEGRELLHGILHSENTEQDNQGNQAGHSASQSSHQTTRQSGTGQAADDQVTGAQTGGAGADRNRVATNQPVDRSEAVVLLAHIEQRLGRYPEALALLRSEVTRAATSSPEAIKLRLELGLTALLANDYPSARADIAWAQDAARAAGDVLGEATASAFAAFGESCLGHTADARAAAERAGSMVDALSDGALAGDHETLCMLGWAEFLLERFADAARHLARGRAVSRRSGHRHGLPHILVGQTLVGLASGQLSVASECAGQAEDAAGLVGSDHLLGIALAVEAPVLLERARPGQEREALEATRRATELLGGSAVDSWWARNALMVQGYAEFSAGGARACVERAIRAGGPDLRLLGAPMVPQYCEVVVGALVRLGDVRRAKAFATLATHTAESLGLPGQSAHAARARGLLAALNDDHEAAVAQFAAADAGFAAAGKPLEQARTPVLAWRSLIATGRRDEAIAALYRVSETAARHGWNRVAGEAELALARLSGTAARRSPHPAHRAEPARPMAPQQEKGALATLTSREREVATLVSAGRSNRQIATRLRLSERTVESHLANAYRKIGVASRVTLARLLLSEQDLLESR